jgi:hypothetical protein
MRGCASSDLPPVAPAKPACEFSGCSRGSSPAKSPASAVTQEAICSLDGRRNSYRPKESPFAMLGRVRTKSRHAL